MGILKRIKSKQINSDKVKQTLEEKKFNVGRKLLLKGLPPAIKLGYKEQKEKGINPTVNSIFNEISTENLDFYHKMKVDDEFIRSEIEKVIKENEGENR